MEGKAVASFLQLSLLIVVVEYLQRKKGLGGESDSESRSDDDLPKPLSHGAPGELPPSDSESEGEEESNEEEAAEPKTKGVEGLIEVQNPNRMVKKLQKAKDVDVNAKVELTRRERYVATWLHPL